MSLLNYVERISIETGAIYVHLTGASDESKKLGALKTFKMNNFPCLDHIPSDLEYLIVE